MSIAPPSARTRVYTASIPDAAAGELVTLSAVENPGRASRRSSSSSVSSVFVGSDEAVALRALAARGAVDPAAVVAHANHHRRPIARRAEHEPARRPACPARVRTSGGSMPVVDRVAQQVHDRIADLVEHRAIELDLLAFDDEVDLLADRCAPRRARRAESGRRSAHIGTMRLAVISSRSSVMRRDDALTVSSSDEIAELRRELREPAARDHQLADEVHQRVEPAHVDADVPRVSAARGAAARRLHAVTTGAVRRARRSRRGVVAHTHVGDVAGAANGLLDLASRTPATEPDREVRVEPFGLKGIERRLDGRHFAELRERLHDDERAHAAQRRVRRRGGCEPARRRRRAPAPSSRAASACSPSPSACERRHESAAIDFAIAAGDRRLHRLLQHVGGAEQHVHHVGVDREVVAAHAIEHGLELVRQLGDDGIAHRRAHALDRVDGAEDRADRRRRRRRGRRARARAAPGSRPRRARDSR